MPADFLSNPERQLYESVSAEVLEPDLRQHFRLTPSDRNFFALLSGD